MTNQLFEKAKQAVAKKHGYRSWYLFTNRYAASISDETMREVAERVANEAVKADRAETTNEAYYDSLQDDHVVSCKVLNRPLPFPQQPDER